MFSVHTKPEKLENAKNHQRYVFQKKCFASTLKLYFDVFNAMQEFYARTIPEWNTLRAEVINQS